MPETISTEELAVHLLGHRPNWDCRICAREFRGVVTRIMTVLPPPELRWLEQPDNPYARIEFCGILMSIENTYDLEVALEYYIASNQPKDTETDRR